ncbi:PH domain-containing protein [Lactiplantibacillus paraplantarum]|uniref:PH domain-containing protein n=1 Tax=Lactiplantibacillus paraplantarum TaxID=60520 RepID=UPI003B27F1F1
MKRKIILCAYHFLHFSIISIGNFSFLVVIDAYLSRYFFLKVAVMFLVLNSVVFFIYRVTLEMFFLFYNIKDNSIHIKSGIFFKKDYNLNYNDFSSLSFHQPIFFRIFNVFQAQIALPSTADNAFVLLPIITMVEKNFLESKVYGQVTEARINETGESSDLFLNKVYRPVPLKKIISSSFVTLNYFYIVTIYLYFSELLEHFNIKIDNVLKNLILIKKYDVLLIFLFILLAAFAAIFKQFITYFKLRLIDHRDYVELENELFKTEKITIRKKDLTGYVITTTIGQAFQHLTSMKAIAWNAYVTDNKVNVNTILPYQEQKELKAKINEIFPKFKINRDVPFFQLTKTRIVFILILTILTASAIIKIKNPYIIFFVLIIDFILCLTLKVITAKITSNETYIFMSIGILKRKNYIIKKAALEWEKNVTFLGLLHYKKVGIKMEKLRKFSFLFFKIR